MADEFAQARSPGRSYRLNSWLCSLLCQPQQLRWAGNDGW